MSTPSPRRFWPFRFFLATAKRRTVNQLSVRCMRPVNKAKLAAFDKLCDAVRLLASSDPVRFARASRDLTCIFLMPLPGHLGQFWVRERACVINSTYCRRKDVSAAEVAGVIAHEAMHARLCAAGIVTTAETLIRIERICIKAEMAFALRLKGVPNAVRVRKNANRRLKHVNIIYDPVLSFERYLKALVHMGVPALLVRWSRRRRAAASSNN